MDERPASRVYTIPHHRAFADALAEGLLKLHGATPLGLARGIILVPNNRAARAITDAFVRRADGGLLLPRLTPIGDEALDERLGNALDPIGDEGIIPPAIEPMRRRMMLARLVQDERVRAGEPVDAAEALRLATELARTLDQMLVEGVEPRALKILEVAGELSEHWQKSLALLTIILDRWPAELERIGRIDLADRRNHLLDKVAERWRMVPPPGFVVAAGINTTSPAVARVLRAVARLPQGMVVFSGLSLDAEMPEEEWDALGPFDPDPITGRRARAKETHPQYHLKLLLDRMGTARGEVETWRWGGGHDARAVRSKAIANAMSPPEFTHKWEDADTERRLGGVSALEAATPAEEAQAIAIALREALDTPGRTAALVTPDRALAGRVSAHLKRWGVDADDSAGQPLWAKAEGTLLLALADAAAEGFAPIALLTLLKHPLVMSGEARGEWLEGVRLLDRALRGPRPPAGLQGVSDYLADTSTREARQRGEALPGWQRIRALLDPLERAFEHGAGLPALLAALREAATALAGDRAWSGPAGRAAAELLADAEAWAVDGPGDVRADSLTPLLRRLMEDVTVRPPQGGHPRIAIWGLIEAHLQQPDLVIAAGLNEGVWPSLPSPDPWLAPRARSELGLPGLERRIGLAAQDLASALGAPQVIITRSRRDASAPTIASRFWLRLAAMTGGLTVAEQYDTFARAIDATPGPPQRAPRPAPSPPLADRPRSISVTAVDRLRADPYSFYARAILKLSALDGIDVDPTAAWRGTAVHDILDKWGREDGYAPELLRPRVEAMFEGPGVHPLQRAFWKPRLMEAIDWIAETIAEARAEGRVPIDSEVEGSAEIAGVLLKGTADRIDRLNDGRIAIVDYKTGSPPSAKAVREGFAMQLGLIGLIAERGGFAGIAGTAGAFEYWSLAKKGDAFGHVASPVAEDGDKGRRIPTADFVATVAARFGEAAGEWLTGEAPFIAKIRPDYSYPEYDQLMRFDEWYGRDG